MIFKVFSRTPNGMREQPCARNFLPSPAVLTDSNESQRLIANSQQSSYSFPFFFIQKYIPQYARVTPKTMPTTIGNRCFSDENVMGISKAASMMK